MKELVGNLWDFHAQGHYICITTNGTVRRDGACVMGRGIAKQAAQRFPDLPFELGRAIRRDRVSRVYVSTRRIIAFPVKHHWRERADLALIQQSAIQLSNVFLLLDNQDRVYLPRPGCGNGGLTWDVVRPFIAPILDDRFTVVEIKP